MIFLKKWRKSSGNPKYSGYIDMINDTLGGALGEIKRTIESGLVKSVMTSCHSLGLVDGRILGDPLELEMFKIANASFKSGIS